MPDPQQGFYEARGHQSPDNSEDEVEPQLGCVHELIFGDAEEGFISQ